MLLPALLISVLLPLQYGLHYQPGYVVQASIDAARIIGLPASRLAIKRIRAAQVPDYLESQSFQAQAPIAWRRLFFRQYFQTS